MTNIDMNVERCEMNQGACDMTADELELVSGGGYVGPAAKATGTAPPPPPVTVGDVLGTLLGTHM